jgi:hypothetical protein
MTDMQLAGKRVKVMVADPRTGRDHGSDNRRHRHSGHQEGPNRYSSGAGHVQHHGAHDPFTDMPASFKQWCADTGALQTLHALWLRSCAEGQPVPGGRDNTVCALWCCPSVHYMLVSLQSCAGSPTQTFRPHILMAMFPFPLSDTPVHVGGRMCRLDACLRPVPVGSAECMWRQLSAAQACCSPHTCQG